MLSNTKIKIVHHHIFKCAGSTFMWVLEKNFPKKLLCIEGEIPRHRITCNDIIPYLTHNNTYKAISSHLLVFPDYNQEIGELHCSFIRNPIKRIYSAYQFQIKSKRLNENCHFEDYCQKTAAFQGNFQVRHSSLQSKDSWSKHKGWSSNLQSIDVNRPDIFFGLVELFDESMVVLEFLMQQKGIAFDGSYHKVINSGKYEDDIINPEVITLLGDKIIEDLILYERVERKLLELFNIIDPNKEKLALFKERCLKLSNETKKIRAPIEKEWIRIPFNK